MAELSTNHGVLPFKPKRKKGMIIIALAAVLAAGTGITLYQKISAQESTTSIVEWAVVKRGDVAETVAASGTVQAGKEISLNFTDGGERLSNLNVKIGDHVKKGQTLASLDTNAARAQVSIVQANLAAAKARLAEAQQGASAQDIAVQRANVNKAKVALDAVKNTFDNQKANNQVEKAKIALSYAKSTYDSQKALYDSGAVAKSELDQAKNNLDQMQEDYNSAMIQYKQAQAQTQNSMSEAQAAYQAAEAQLKQLQSPPKESAILAAKAEVDQAEAQLEEQQVSLAKLTLTAPIDGVIVQVNGNEGEVTTSNQPVIVMDTSDSENLQVMAKVSQSDISKIKPGMNADLTASSFEGKEFQGKIQMIYPNASTDGGVTTYNVLLSVDNNGLLLKPGMTTSVKIQAGIHKNVVYIPPGALKDVNGEDGVYVLAASASSAENSGTNRRMAGNRKIGNQNLRFQPVTAGFFNADKVEIISGLKEGDRVAQIYDNPSTASSSNRNQMRGFSGGGIPGLGGRRGGN